MILAKAYHGVTLYEDGSVIEVLLTLPQNWDEKEDGTFYSHYGGRKSGEKPGEEASDSGKDIEITAPGKVILTKRTTKTEQKFDAAIIDVTTWHTKITASNNPETTTTYYTITHKGEERQIESESEAITTNSSKENESYSVNKENKTSKDEEIIKEAPNTLGFQKYYTLDTIEATVLNYIYNSIIKADENYSSYTSYHTMNVEYGQQNTTTLITRADTTLVRGNPEELNNTDVFLAMLSNDKGYYNPYDPNLKFVPKSQEGKIVRYGDIFNKLKQDPTNFMYLEKGVQVGELLENGAELLFDRLEDHPETQDLSPVMRYIMWRYSGTDYGVTDFNFILQYFGINTIAPTVIGGTIEEKIWLTFKAAGIPDVAIAAAMGNLCAESEIRTNNLEDKYQSGGELAYVLGGNYTDESYTAAVNDGSYSLERFISDHIKDDCGAGYGLAQWTYYSRKEGLYKFAKKRGVSIDDEDMQVEYLLGELTPGGGADGCAEFQLGTPVKRNGKTYTYSTWFNAKNEEDLKEATRTFLYILKPEVQNETVVEKRTEYAKGYLEKYKDLLSGGGIYTPRDKSTGIEGSFLSGITGREFAIYNQNNDNIKLPRLCNRALAAAIASGYREKQGHSEMDVVEEVRVGGGSILSNMQSTTDFFAPYGLAYRLDTYSIDTIRTELIKGNYITIHLKGGAVYGQSGSKYNGERKQDRPIREHWVGIIGYGHDEKGNEIIFVTEPAYGSSGWKPITEFEKNLGKWDSNTNIAHFGVVYENR